MLGFFSSNLTESSSFSNNNAKISEQKHQKQQKHNDNIDSNCTAINFDDNVKGAAVSYGLLGLLTCGLTGGEVGTFLGCTCAKDNTGPVGEVFREIGDATCTTGQKVAELNLTEKSENAIKSLMSNNDYNISNMHNSNGVHVRNFEKID